MTDRELMQQALEALESAKYGMAECRQEIGFDFANEQYDVEQAITALRERLAQPEQKPFFTEANGFPQTFVPKDGQTQAIRSLTDQCAELVRERDELQKQVWLYEKNGVTCQTYRHTVEQSCVECNVQMSYTTPPRREWVGLTDREIEEIARHEDKHGSGPWHLAFARAIEAKLKEQNA